MPKYAVTVDSGQALGSRFPTRARDEINAVIAAATPRFLKWSGTAWPDRPADSRMTFFIGGSATTDAPTDADLASGDVWIPATA